MRKAFFLAPERTCYPQKALPFALFLACLFASSAAWGADATGSLALASKPAGCQFSIIDGEGKVKAKGKTPFVGVLPAGRYLIKIGKPGFFAEQRGFLLKAGQQRILQLTLIPNPKARVAPPAARVPAVRTAPTKAPTPRTTPKKVVERTVPVVRRATTPAARTPAKARTPAASRTASPAQRRTTPAPTKAVAPAKATPPARATPRAAAPPARATPAPAKRAAAPTAREPAKRAIAPRQRVATARPTPRRASPNTTTIDPPKKGTKKADGKKKKKKGRSIPWIPLAAAGGLAVAGGIFWGLSGGSLSGAKDRSKFQRDAFQEYQQGRTHRSTAIFLFAAGGAALGLAALFYFWNPSRKQKKPKPVDNSTPIGKLPTNGPNVRFALPSSSP